MVGKRDTSLLCLLWDFSCSWCFCIGNLLLQTLSCLSGSGEIVTSLLYVCSLSKIYIETNCSAHWNLLPWLHGVLGRQLFPFPLPSKPETSVCP